MVTDSTLRALTCGVGVAGVGLAAAAVWRLLAGPVASPLVGSLLAVGALAGLVCATGAVLGYRRIGTADAGGSTPMAPAASAAAMSGAVLVVAVQDVSRTIRTAALLAGGLALVGTGLLLVASSRQ